MTHPRLRFIRKGQRGFTLVELIIAIAIAGLITGGITAAVMQVLTINSRSSNHMIAVRQVQQAGKEVSKDALQSQNVNPAEAAEEDPFGTNFPLSFNWTDWEGLENVVVYTIEDGELKRSHSVNGTAQTTAPAVVAEYIDVTLVTAKAKTNCDWNEASRVLTFTVTATVGTESETRIYEVEPRPG
jgi:prepilin-type N-terminal cleavage/methylation domain-containing protein